MGDCKSGQRKKQVNINCTIDIIQNPPNIKISIQIKSNNQTPFITHSLSQPHQQPLQSPTQIMSQDYRLKLSKNFDKKNRGQGIEILKGQKMINSVTYRIELQDHTIGDLTRIYLLKNKDVKFAGYRVPHPLDDILEIKVQTSVENTNQVVKDTLSKLGKELWELEKDFDQALIDKERKGI